MIKDLTSATADTWSIPEEDHLDAGQATTIGSLVVDEITQEADGVLSFRLRPESGDEIPLWEPGAHIALELPNGLTRQYSLCGRLEDRSAFTIAVLRESVSRGGSAYLHEQVAVGDIIRAGEIRNNFPLLPASEYVFVAGGIGLTPMIPMIERVQSHGLPWRLVYGSRNRNSMAFTSLLSEYGNQVLLWPQDECGFINFTADVTDIATPGTHVYACGPEPMLTALLDHTSKQGVPAHIERFKASDEMLRGTGQNWPFSCTLRKTGRTVQVGPDETIVEALEHAGIFIQSDCREGTCGTCETPVLKGSVDHRDALLSETERTESKTMMICVSRALSEELILDR